MTIRFTELDEFERDKHHLRKYRHIEEDILVFRQALVTNPTGLSGVFEISEKDRKFKNCIYKAKKFRSRDIPNKGSQSGFRIIYHYDNTCELIILIEIYHKSEQQDYNRDRLIKHFPLNQ